MSLRSIFWKLEFEGCKCWLKKLLVISFVVFLLSFGVLFLMFHEETSFWLLMLYSLIIGAVMIMLPVAIGMICILFSYFRLMRECRYLRISIKTEIHMSSKDLTELSAGRLQTWNNKEWFVASAVEPQNNLFAVNIFYRDYVDCVLKEQNFINNRYHTRSCGTCLKRKNGKSMWVVFYQESQRDDFSKWVRRIGINKL